MASADAALDFFRQRLGLGETPPGSNHNEITSLFGLGDVPWCAETVSFALNVAWGDAERWQVPGVRSTYAIGTAYVPYLRNYFIEAGRYDQDPRPGDVVIFAWGPGEPIGDHTGLVEQVLGDGTVVTLEGNDSDNAIGRHRRTMAVIDGFGHPPYDATPAPPSPPTPQEALTMQRQLVNEGADYLWLGPERIFTRITTGGVFDVLAAGKDVPRVEVDDETLKVFRSLAHNAGFTG